MIRLVHCKSSLLNNIVALTTLFYKDSNSVITFLILKSTAKYRRKRLDKKNPKRTFTFSWKNYPVMDSPEFNTENKKESNAQRLCVIIKERLC